MLRLANRGLRVLYSGFNFVCSKVSPQLSWSGEGLRTEVAGFALVMLSQMCL